MIDPPAGYDDCQFDADRTPLPVDGYRGLWVDDQVGEVQARPPLPNAVAVLGAASRAKIPAEKRIDHLTGFLLMHLQPGEYDRVLLAMARDAMPADTVSRIHRAISTWGTARPTVPSLP